MKNAKTLVELAQSLETMRASTRDFVVPVNQITMDSNANIVFNSVDKEQILSPNTWSSSQISSYLDIPKTYYDRLKTENKSLLADNVNHGFLKNSSDNRMIRTVGNNVRAFVSNKYRRLDSFDLLNEILPVMLEKNFVVDSCELTEKRTYIKALMPKVTTEIKKGDIVQYGLCISNSDVGAGSLRVEPLIYRLVCSNGLILNSAIKKYHIGKSQGEADTYELFSDDTKELTDKTFWAQVKDVILGSMELSYFEKQVDKLRLAANEPIKNFDLPRVVELTMRELGISGDVTKNNILASLANGSDGAGLTKWGLINSVTFAAKDDSINYDQSVEIERSANKILDLTASQWQAISSN